MVSISKEALEACDKVTANDGLRYAVMKIDDATDQLALEDFSDYLSELERSASKSCNTQEEVKQAFEQLVHIVREHRTRSPRFCLFNFSTTEEGKVVLIYWAPISAVTMAKLRYNKAKQEVFDGIDNVQSMVIVKSLEQLDYDTVLQKM